MRPCVLKCRLYGSQKCGACPIPDERGKARCPDCRQPLYVIGGGKLICDNRRGRPGCGRTVTLPVGDPEAEAVAQAELAEFKRLKRAGQQRARRAQKRTAQAEAA